MPKNSRITIGLLCLSLTACNENIFDFEGEQHVRVYQDDQAISCEDTGAVSVKTHGKLLIDEDIELHCSQKGDDGMSYTESCGSQTGSINIFTIHDKDLGTAESLGFSRLSTLPDAQFDAKCEYKVISDSKKYALINQLDEQHSIWQANKTANYQFQFNMSYSDCPTFVPTPIVTITVNNDAINTVYDINNDTFLSNISQYMTIDELYSELKLQLQLTPIEAGLNVNEQNKLPKFSNTGIPEQYYINAGREECDAANYTISDFVIL
ncbi:DUF6174 domain-containing protein [Paraglaciecola arctica]|uniref:Lipoprotein n=1 Tax=Paraglaciecola arctica BSs20135 TaxID=493475 RepID=K6XJ43_9ALTE|nr:DUF6174 domain-containing protein [Paraglaciecola arctica]GAC20689.1 hypothetical protein GARC_3735 [Paraglaciecola arctica BSs20135]